MPGISLDTNLHKFDAISYNFSTISNQRLEQFVRARTLHFWSTLVTFETQIKSENSNSKIYFQK